MIVVNLAAEEAFHRVHDAVAADEGAVDVVAQFVLDLELDGAALAVAAAGGGLLHLMIGPADLPQ